MLSLDQEPARPPQHTRRIPDEWEDLQASAGNYQDVRAAVADLSNERLDVNRYYAIGQILCIAARKLQMPAVYAGAIGISADALREGYIRQSFTINRPFAKVAPEDLPRFTFRNLFPPVSKANTGPLSVGLEWVLTDAQERLSKPDRLLANSLVFEAGERKSRRPAGDNEFAARLIRRMLTSEQFAASVVGSEAASGTIRSYRAIINSRRGLPLYASSAIEPSDFRDIDADMVLAQYASLHMDTFLVETSDQRDKEGILDVDTACPRLKPEILRADPASSHPIGRLTAALHTEKLRCPALNVAGLIPTVSGMIPDILELTQRTIGMPAR